MESRRLWKTTVPSADPFAGDVGMHHSLPLDSVITTQELFNRESRQPDYEGESRALCSLMEVMAETPGIILQRLAETTLQLCGAHSAGVSLLEDDGGSPVFRWCATAGAWTRFAGETMPRGASPCGAVLDRNASLLFTRPQRHFAIPKELNPEIVEALLVPFRVLGNSVGTIWVISHDESRRFDAEDWRLLSSLARFAANAYQILGGIAELDSANSSKVHFLAEMSHQVRTPLNAIMGYVQLLELDVHGVIAIEQRDDLARIRENAGFLLNLFGDVLSFAKLEAGSCAIDITDVNADSVIESVDAVCKVTVSEKGISLTHETSQHVQAVRADPLRLKQILVRLIEYVSNHTPSGAEISVSYSADVESRQGCIVVRDRELQLSDNSLPHLFDPFVCDASGTDNDRNYSGLDLAIIRMLAREMNGDVIATASPGDGATFTVSLPLSQGCTPGCAA